ncbi:MAG: membrane dipeptidase [Syntrophobacteraceae bacterium]
MSAGNQDFPTGRPFQIVDGHVDILYEMTNSHPRMPFDRLTELPVTVEKMRAADVRVLIAALYCPDTHNGMESAAPFLRGLISYAEKYLTGLVHIGSKSDLESCFKTEAPGMILLVENADGLLELDRNTLAQAGIKVAGLTHMGRNRIGDGNNVPFPGGLSEAGKKLVRELSAEGFAFDAAHLAEPGFHDLARIHEGPLLSSHTGVRALCDIPRNLGREQIREIFERKGVVGVAADPAMLSIDGSAGIEDMFRHIDWIAQSFEADGIAIGSDFCGFYNINRGMEDISMLPALADLLLHHGYPEESVRGIMGMNWYDFYRALLP